MILGMNPETTVIEGRERDKWRRMAVLVQEAGPSALDYLKPFRRLTWERFLLRNILVFFLQYTGFFFSTLSVSSVAWFASGTACGFLFLRGNNVLPGLSLGSFLAYYAAGLDWKRSLACSLVMIAQALLLVKLNYRASILSLVFYKRSDFLKFIGRCFVVTFGATVLLVSLCLPALQHPPSFTELSLHWWLANLNGTIIFACAFYVWDAFFPDLFKLKKISKLKLLLVFGLFIFSILAFLQINLPLESFLFLGATWLGLLWISRLYRCCGVNAALFLLAFILQCALLFNLPGSHFQVNESTLMLQFFLLGCAITGMALAI